MIIKCRFLITYGRFHSHFYFIESSSSTVFSDSHESFPPVQYHPLFSWSITNFITRVNHTVCHYTVSFSKTNVTSSTDRPWMTVKWVLVVLLATCISCDTGMLCCQCCVVSQVKPRYAVCASLAACFWQSTVNHHWHTEVSWWKSVPRGHKKENIWLSLHTWYTWEGKKMY